MAPQARQRHAILETRVLVGAYAGLRSPRGRWALGAGTGIVTLGLAALAARHFAAMSWPLSTRHPGLLVAAGLLLVLAQALKAFGWGRLFTRSERPAPLALAAGNGGAALVGVLLPGRFDDAMRVAVVRRYPGCRAGVRVILLSLVMLGLIDSVALAPLALAGAALPNVDAGVRAGLAVVGAGGIAAAVVIVLLPRLAASRWTQRFRLGRWVSPRTTSLRHASEAWALVSACWLARAVAFFLLLAAFGVGYSLTLTLLFLCTGAAAAALPIGLAGTATQVGGGGAVLVAAGVGASQALHAAVSIGVLGVITGTAVLVAAIVWRSAASLLGSRTPLSVFGGLTKGADIMRMQAQPAWVDTRARS
jgi:hypothetical protein